LWYRSGIKPVPIRWLLVRDPTGELEPQAFLATDPGVDPRDIITWFVRRWQVEVTFEEVRAHLGVETQRQWSDKAILRTTSSTWRDPCLQISGVKLGRKPMLTAHQQRAAARRRERPKPAAELRRDERWRTPEGASPRRYRTTRAIVTSGLATVSRDDRAPWH